ncbi:MAG: YkgJ family cysteine cluster protein [Candidatus Bathyarchaeia archaeon]
MSEDQNGKTYSFDVCSQCSMICCQDANPPLTSNRRKILTEYVKAQNLSVTELFAGTDYSHPATDSDGVCVFYNKKTRRCMVHPVKPETCRAGPITFDINLQTRKVEFYLKEGKICAFAQFLFENEENLKQHLEGAKPEIMRLICELDVDELKAILMIPEPETFKVDENELPKEVAEKLGIEH